MIARMILPVLGGSAAVWTTCVVFFQVMLLAGYGYAHVIATMRPSWKQYVVHAAILIAGFVVLPLGFSAGSGTPAQAPAAWVFWHLLLVAGLPFFAVSATAPLVQKWVSQTRLAWADDPYFLYGVSNAGSLLALAAYPTIIEPRFGVSQQSLMWRYAYVVLVVLLALSLVALSRLMARSDAEPVPRAATSRRTAPAWRSRLGWLAAAFVPSALMLAVTSHITVNLGSFPFLWVAPLGLYLLTFVLAFARKVRIPTTVVSTIATVVVAALFAIATAGVAVRSSQLRWMIGAHLLLLFAAALLCHSFLADRRPQAKHLTDFYVFVALGGVLGGVFTGLIAPSVFTTVLEYPLLVAAVMFFRQLRQPSPPFSFADLFDLVLFALFTLFVFFAVLSWAGIDISRSYTTAPVIAAHAALISALWLFRRKAQQFALAFALLVGAYSFVLPRQFEEASRVHVARNFFGVKKVLYEADIHMRKLLHGDTLHGRESMDPELAGQPLSYYHRTGPVGDVMRLLEAKPGARIAVVGLGTGSVAAYGTDNRHITFFDVDPQMVDVARRFFSFVNRCGDDCDIQTGDGRLLLERQPDGEYDAIILDAFSSDAIPAHLVSREAVRMYLSKLNASGLLMFHVSNRYLDVETLVSTALVFEGVTAFVRHDSDETPPGKSSSHYVVALKDPQAMESVPHREEWTQVFADGKIRPWTDDFSDLLSILK
jgi:spermidine synthase